MSRLRPLVRRLHRRLGSPGWRTALVALAALLVVGAATVLVRTEVGGLLGPGSVRQLLERAGPYAPLVFVGLQALQVVVAPVPGQLLAGVGGYLFGGVLGTVYSMIGVVIGSLVVFAAAGRYGRPLVERLLAAETRERFDAFGARNGPLALFVFFLLPVFPDDALCVLAGLWEIRPRTFLVLLVVGRTPSFVAASYAGTSLYEGAVGRLALLLAGFAAVVLAVHLGRDRIERGLAADGGTDDP